MDNLRLEFLPITRADFAQLLEYSTSIPTGQTIGKRWRAYRGGQWLVGEYVPAPVFPPDPYAVSIRWYLPVLLPTTPDPCPDCEGTGVEYSGVCHCGESIAEHSVYDNHCALEMTRRCETCGGSGILQALKTAETPKPTLPDHLL